MPRRFVLAFVLVAAVCVCAGCTGANPVDGDASTDDGSESCFSDPPISPSGSCPAVSQSQESQGCGYNVRDHLSESRRAYVAKQMRDAYNSTTASTAKKKLMQLASWLESNGEDSAAASLREGLDETLTVMRLNLPATLRRTFATTERDREHERFAPTHRAQRQAMEG